MPSLRKIILIGMKSSGKTTTGTLLARRLGIPFADMDVEIEKMHCQEKKELLRFREIFQKYGKDYFRTLETAALQAFASAMASQSFVLATGGGLPLTKENQPILRGLGTIVFLDVRQDVLYSRIVARGIPAFFPYPDDPRRSLAEILDHRRPVYMELANLTLEFRSESPRTIVDRIINKLEIDQHED